MISQKKKRLLCEYVDFICELCKQKKDLSEFHIHRIRRGSQGGTYHHRNCQVLCVRCHKIIHAGEFR